MQQKIGGADNYALGMLKLLKSEEPEDIVFATRSLTQLGEFLALASETVGFNQSFEQGIMKCVMIRRLVKK